METAFNYVIEKGLEDSASYPYKGVSGTCNYNAAKVKAYVGNYHTVYHSAAALVSAIHTTPTSVAVDASSNAFVYYDGGILTSSTCGTPSLNHGVLAVGYGSDPQCANYAIVKNSWGSDWGLNGYINICLDNNACGILDAASYPTW